MSANVRRGRLIYLVFAIAIVVDLVSSAVLSLILNSENFSLLKSVVIPLAVIYFILDLWQGDKLTRWLLASWTLVRGAGNLFTVALILYRLASVTKPEQTDFFIDVIVIPFLIPMLYGVFYLAAGLTLLLSPSIKLFCERQSKLAEGVFETIYEWVLGLFQKDRASKELRRFRRELANRTHYPVLTREILDSLNDHELIDAIVDHARLITEKDYDRKAEILATLPRGIQAVYRTWWVDIELGNGGFYQYFFHKGIDEAFLALEGYKLLGEQEAAGLMARAIEISLQEEEHLENFSDDPAEIMEQYVAARKASSLPELDGLFYELQPGEATLGYIRAHADEFVSG